MIAACHVALGPGVLSQPHTGYERLCHVYVRPPTAGRRPLKAFYCDHFVLPLPEGHRFPMAKYQLLRERLVIEGVISPDDLVEPEAASRDDLALVHDHGYIDAVQQGTLPREAQRRIGFPWSPAMVERSKRSVGGTIGAARLALRDGVAVNLAGGTHHAFPDRGEGFCVFNDVAVAARVLARDCGISRTLVVDLDVHQGNGTAVVFRHDSSVFTFSMHGEKNFPFRKEASDLDVTLPDGAGDTEYPRHARPAPAPPGRDPATGRGVLRRGRRPVRA